MNLRFFPINMAADFKRCVAFREDATIISFGDAEKFYGSQGTGAQNYKQWLLSQIKNDSDSIMHVWDGNELVGQLEMGPSPDDAQVGYVYLYYVIPEKRRTGLGAALDTHAIKHLKEKGYKKANLSVSKTNDKAISFYTKRGWKNLGERPGKSDLILMEKPL